VSLRIEPLAGEALIAALDDLARLRIRVFREWPYLYDGDLGYERRYLAAYRDSQGAILAGAFDGDRLVGAATGTPMEDHADDFAAALAGTGLPPETIFYCGESLLLPEYRGGGAGHRFFDLREAHARALGRTTMVFCSVLRPEDHPARPEGYRPLDAFWQRRGYRPLPDGVAWFSWKDLGCDAETRKPLQVWMKTL
jgi:GNAT superfamily N-acetyltransferase